MYVQKLSKNRMEKPDEKQDFFFHQHFWIICWPNMLYAYHDLPVS